ncbi:arylesterase [Phaeobacter sp. HF9A]|uniref:arylesterase n=1 Tax=Phaeobacter sp. HF9A TaxID=2721561 RepID=UPI0020CA507B|nr:arylesterase [Phaeobacter sp. HF9A]
MAEPLKLTVFGDSLVQGYGLAQGDGLVPQLQRWLAAQDVVVQVVNAGVSGDTSAGGAARIDWALADHPDGVIVLLGGNDLLRGLPPQDTRANLSHIIEAAQGAGAEVMLVGMQAPLNYGAEYKAQFDAIYSDLAQRYGVLLHPLAFAGIMQEVGSDPAQFGAYMQDDNIHPNARGVALNVAAMGPQLLDLLKRMQQAQAQE